MDDFRPLPARKPAKKADKIGLHSHTKNNEVKPTANQIHAISLPVDNIPTLAVSQGGPNPIMQLREQHFRAAQTHPDDSEANHTVSELDKDQEPIKIPPKYNSIHDQSDMSPRIATKTIEFVQHPTNDVKRWKVDQKVTMKDLPSLPNASNSKEKVAQTSEPV